MAELEELSHKIHVLIAQLEQLHDENETLKNENKELHSGVEKRKHDIEELMCELARCHHENEMLKREVEVLSQKLQMNEMQMKEMSVEPVAFTRVKPYDSDWDTQPVAENDRKKGGKKTSL